MIDQFRLIALTMMCFVCILFFIWHRSRRPLLILDMNNVLVCRAFVPTQAEEQPETVPYNVYATTLGGGRFHTWKRPNLDAFIQRCFAKYTVAVWTSAQRENANDLVDFVFGEDRKKLLFVWDQSHCEAVEGSKKPLFKKQLARVWASYTQYNETNTYIVDDSADKVRDNPPRTWIRINPWTVTNQNDEELESLLH